jgi:hypothetical protein
MIPMQVVTKSSDMYAVQIKDFQRISNRWVSFNAVGEMQAGKSKNKIVNISAKRNHF